MSRDYIPALRFKALTRFYDPVVRWTTREGTVKRALIEAAHLSANATVLDLGCGTGTLAVAIKRLQPGARVIGVDVDTNVLAYARAKAETAGLDIEFLHADATRLPLNDALADCVVSSLFIHHLMPQDKTKALSEAMRVLKAGGGLHIADWDKPANGLMRGLFFLVRLLDGFSNTADHARGRLPALVFAAGGSDVRVSGSYNTIFGTLSLIHASKAV